MKTDNRPEGETSHCDQRYGGFYKVIAPLIMCSGVGDGKTTACVMAQAATIDALRRGETLDKPTDEMECACPVLRRMAIRANDTPWWSSDIERTELLRPLIPVLLDSKKPKAVTQKRIFKIADNVVRVLTPERLKFISEHTKSKKVKSDNEAGIKLLFALSEIVDKETALAASQICSKLKLDAYADADASADASAYASASASASAYADAYASASASASASAYADAYASASASAYASADAYADASADASAYADAYADAIKQQKIKYRTMFLELFMEVAAIKD